MIEIIYSIDRAISEKIGCLAIQLSEAMRDGHSLQPQTNKNPITLQYWQKLSTLKDKDPLKIMALKDVRMENSYLKIPYSQSVQALKLLAASGKFFFHQKQLICDFFTPVEFYFVVKNNCVEGRLKFHDQDIGLSSLDFLCQGSKPWFIKGNLLKLIHTEISWKKLNQLYQDPIRFSLKTLQEDQENDPDYPRVIDLDNTLENLKQNDQPLPVLFLKDRSGAFADLWMKYGPDKIYPYHETSSQIKRDSAAEKNWEKDLLETDFIKKQVSHSHYYCPLDRVSKSILFLLEIGWEIRDYQNKKIHLLSQAHLEISMKKETIMVIGKLRYDSYEAPLQEVSGAFNRRERFVQLDPENVGLLPEKWNQTNLVALFEDGEVVSEGLKFKKHQLGSLETLFQDPLHKHSLDESLQRLKNGLMNLTEIPDIKPDASFQGSLRAYQQQGVNWLNFLYHFGLNGILSDDMGLGKTVQVLAFLSSMENPLPILIVMPTSLIFNWKREIERFLPSRKIIYYQGSDRKQSLENLSNYSIILTSYAVMRMDIPLLAKLEFSAVILDEAQAIKNAHTQVAQAAYQLNSPFRLLVTGTPIENHLNELWSHFHFLMPDLLGDEKIFEADLQASYLDNRYLHKIKKKIRPFVLRRKKIEVAKDLPECVEQTVWVEMSPGQKQVYESYLASIKSNLLTKINAEGVSKHRIEIFEAILRLRQICCHPLIVSSQISPSATDLDSGKMEALMQDLENLIEEGDKALIYSQFTSVLSLIAKEVSARNWKFTYLDGSTKDREKPVNQFQEDPETHLFLISLKAGGTGLNLTAADHVLIYDPWWNEAAENQAINRAHRIGRSSTVFAKRYVTVESIEEKIMKLKERKKFLIDSVLDDESSFTALTLEDFSYLLS